MSSPLARPYTPVGPNLSIFDPLFIGLDEFGQPVHLSLIYRNILLGGEPGAGKSSLLNNVVGHAALSDDTDLVLIDGKLVELGLWRECADVFVGPDLDHAIDTLERLQKVMDNRYEYLDSQRRQKIVRDDVMRRILLAIDELAYFSATVGTKIEQDHFSALNRDIAARGRAVGIVDASATQRPSSDIIPTSLRCLFAWRWAGRCVDDSSSDVVLGHGWTNRGYSAARIDPNNQGEGLLLAEDGIPVALKAAHMTNDDIIRVADYAASVRRTRAANATTPNLGAVA
ncbi:FtsK/SpoIIIE domain-containing protein [Actinoplanes flavus]|uniref:Cell division protein FtsK n=1 Tax=Actinoplanes flavus TaxID=2820290 RepID=A0ABS3UI09_9ACTN|nr:FtsK/SpoIIIE domain-containing protein [Actinoplanes flavus]MBO3738412.1 cell division protein FtsK [Actinoplanes flavus]